MGTDEKERLTPGESYRQLYLLEFGVELSIEEAAEQAQRFLNAARIVLQPMPKRFLPRYNELLVQKKKVLPTD